MFEEMEARPVFPQNLRVGMLVKVVCYADCVFPIKGIDAGLLSLEAACGNDVTGMEWGVFCGPMESFQGMVVRIGGGPVVEVLLREHLVVIDRGLMESEPYDTPWGTWRMFELREDE